MKTILFLSLFFSLGNNNIDGFSMNKRLSGIVHETKKSNFEGEWINVDAETRHITRCIISMKGKSMLVQMWGACVPVDCNWGENTAGGVGKENTTFELLWDYRFAESVVTYELVDGKLKLTDNISYKDHSGRANSTNVSYFKKK